MKAVPLAVSGAFHTPLMQPAHEALTQVQPRISLCLTEFVTASCMQPCLSDCTNNDLSQNQ